MGNAFKNGPREICGRQPLKNFNWYGLPKSYGLIWYVLLGPFLNTLSHITQPGQKKHKWWKAWELFLKTLKSVKLGVKKLILVRFETGFHNSEAVTQRCSVKNVFLEILENSQEKTWAYNFIKKETLTPVFTREFCEISKNIFSYRTPLVAASDNSKFTGL